MLKLKSSRLSLVVVGAAILIVTAGGAAVASNMGFKINKALVIPPNNTEVNKGRNWTSIPYNQPYTTGCGALAPNGCAKAFCDATGLTACGGLGQTQIRTLNPVDFSFQTTNCPSAAAPTLGNNFQLPAGRFLDIRPSPTCAVTNIIIVGSHNPSLSITVNPATGTLGGRVWFSVPYHATAITTRDLCLQAGLKSSGVLPFASIQTLDPVSGNFASSPCNAAGANLVLGQGVQLTQQGVATTFVPAHF